MHLKTLWLTMAWMQTWWSYLCAQKRSGFCWTPPAPPWSSPSPPAAWSRRSPRTSRSPGRTPGRPAAGSWTGAARCGAASQSPAGPARSSPQDAPPTPGWARRYGGAGRPPSPECGSAPSRPGSAGSPPSPGSSSRRWRHWWWPRAHVGRPHSESGLRRTHMGRERERTV